MSVLDKVDIDGVLINLTTIFNINVKRGGGFSYNLRVTLHFETLTIRC